MLSPATEVFAKYNYMRRLRTVARMGRRVLVGKPHIRRPLEISRHGSDDDMVLIVLAGDRNQWLGLVEHINEPSGVVMCWEILE
jgi:hypothetical protein